MTGVAEENDNLQGNISRPTWHAAEIFRGPLDIAEIGSWTGRVILRSSAGVDLWRVFWHHTPPPTSPLP